MFERFPKIKSTSIFFGELFSKYLIWDNNKLMFVYGFRKFSHDIMSNLYGNFFEKDNYNYKKNLI